MSIFKIYKSFLGCVAAASLFLGVVSCQESGREGQLKKLAREEDERERIVVPASFTADSAKRLGHQLDSIFTYLHKRRGFNGTVLVTKYDQVMYKGAFGFSDFYTKDTLSTETAFQLASVSKQFTAMAIMMLKEQGKLQYDDSVQQYLPEFPYKGITIRQLLTHRSGLANYTYFSDKLWPDRNKPITNQDVVNLMAAHQPAPYHMPNTHFDYSNTGYALLASVVAKASEMPFAAFLDKHIFDPLQMKDTFTYGNEKLGTPESIATGHTGRRSKRTPDYLDTVLGDKGVFSTVEDLYKWDQALYTQKLVSRKALAEAFTGTRTEKNVKEDYGFGWRIGHLESGDTVVYHAGLWHGYTTYLLRNPKDHSALIILSNLPNGSLGYLKELKKFLYPAPKPQLAQSTAKQSKATDSRL